MNVNLGVGIETLAGSIDILTITNCSLESSIQYVVRSLVGMYYLESCTASVRGCYCVSSDRVAVNQRNHNGRQKGLVASMAATWMIDGILGWIDGRKFSFLVLRFLLAALPRAFNIVIVTGQSMVLVAQRA